MKTVSTEITAGLQAQVQSQSFEGVLNSMQVPADQSKQIVEAAMGKVSSNLVMTNPQPAGMQNQMGKWKAFFSLRLVNLLISLIAPLIAIGIYFMVQGYGMETFMKLWLLHSVQLFVCIEFTSIFIMLLGQGGMLINLPILLSQTIANGTTMPPEMMPGYFKFMSHITPMFYSTHLDYNILFGGGKTSDYGIGLALVGLAALAINIVIHQFKSARQSDAVKETVQQSVMV